MNKIGKPSSAPLYLSMALSPTKLEEAGGGEHSPTAQGGEKSAGGGSPTPGSAKEEELAQMAASLAQREEQLEKMETLMCVPRRLSHLVFSHRLPCCVTPHILARVLPCLFSPGSHHASPHSRSRPLIHSYLPQSPLTRPHPHRPLLQEEAHGEA